ncbi:hypothetical protein BDY19DRAFT_926803 [Irpex rosettiformis]|uniref:Uncharacterized protein n=1 Tax=Irpex rosettiformis TaxID=378272 RepID=A0ACB8UEW2_9APHY|nr:hypothetical protein BDY19DRAFT_926803 [Irpex rosettiformis]
MTTTESVQPHAHTNGKCPITGATGVSPHAFCPPQEGDSRAPCPAMNSMANHGYLPRDGREINADIIIEALMECFRLSKPLAWFLTHGALTLLNQGSAKFQLSDLARHDHIEHNASLYHPDAGERDEYAPLHGDPELLKLVFEDSEGGVIMTPEDIAKVRVRRELTSNPPLDFIHAELARGEIAIVLNMFNNPDPELYKTKNVPFLRRTTLGKIWKALLRRKDDPATTPLDGAPIERMRYWFEHERLPEDWKPYHKTTLTQTVITVSRIRDRMHLLEREIKKKAKTAAKTKEVSAPAPVSTSAPEPVAVPVSVPEPSVIVAKAEEEKTKPVSVSDGTSSDSGIDDGTTLTVPRLMRDSSVTSATDSEFSTIHTPQSSEFAHAHVPSKDGEGYELRLPEISEHIDQKAMDVALYHDAPVVGFDADE